MDVDWLRFCWATFQHLASFSLANHIASNQMKTQLKSTFYIIHHPWFISFLLTSCPENRVLKKKHILYWQKKVLISSFLLTWPSEVISSAEASHVGGKASVPPVILSLDSFQLRGGGRTGPKIQEAMGCSQQIQVGELEQQFFTEPMIESMNHLSPWPEAYLDIQGMSTCHQVWGSFERGLATKSCCSGFDRSRSREIDDWKNAERNDLEHPKKYNTRKTAVFHAVKMQHKVKHMAGVEQGGADLSCQLMSACCKCLLQIPPFTQIIVAWLRI